MSIVYKLTVNSVIQLFIFSQTLRFLPESPRWLIKVGRVKAAMTAIKYIATLNKKVISPDIYQLSPNIQDQTDQSREVSNQ